MAFRERLLSERVPSPREGGLETPKLVSRRVIDRATESHPDIFLKRLLDDAVMSGGARMGKGGGGWQALAACDLTVSAVFLSERRRGTEGVDRGALRGAERVTPTLA